ncbi:FAD/NAD(P)-binding protein [Rhodoblastus sp.]|uniref:FAD/NAD(P)-binding protein n=1 Tax=Rhodoblastus sp. TaxID=1962975 RepID=UPI003F94F61A
MPPSVTVENERLSSTAPAPAGGLLALVSRLDALGAHPTLLDMARVMQGVDLTLADVAPYVRSNSRSYNRAAVAVRESYELLVMTWLPGQASPPHDHSGSVCVLKVVQGAAMEGCYRLGADGYADFDYETKLETSGVAAFQDAGVHSVRNASVLDALVTVHAYAPKLRDFRRFVVRPDTVFKPASEPRENPTVVIVGGGFSGAMTAAQLLRRASRAGVGLNVTLVERRGAVGEGVAYATREPTHLLNVPAQRMSAWPDRPGDFLHWAQGRDSRVGPYDFLPREWYGDYIRDSLRMAAREAGERLKFSVVYDEARRVARRPGGGWMIHLERDASLCAAAVVLALGHRPPADPIGENWQGPTTRLIADPWRPFAMNVVQSDEPVIAIGSGLTAVDVVLSLSAQPRSAPITLVSRYGLHPLAHAAQEIRPADLTALVEELLAAPGGLRPLALLVALRRKARAEPECDWRRLVDGLRPHTAKLWQAMTSKERRRFLRHLRPFWEVHRHRLAPSIAARFFAMIERGEVRVIAGQVVAVHADGGDLRASVRLHGSRRRLELEAGWLINCTGPTPSNNAEANPVIASLLVHDRLRVDELALGVETAPDGAAIAGDGKRVQDMFVVGTLRKASLWESIAAPELREQASAAAEGIVRLLAEAKEARAVSSRQVFEPKQPAEAALEG